MKPGKVLFGLKKTQISNKEENPERFFSSDKSKGEMRDVNLVAYPIQNNKKVKRWVD